MGGWLNYCMTCSYQDWVDGLLNVALTTTGANTKAKFRNSTLLNKMSDMRESTDLTALAESALAYFKVSDYIIMMS